MTTFEIYSVSAATTSVLVALLAIGLSFWSVRMSAKLSAGFDEVGRVRWAKISCLRQLMANRHAISKLGTTESREAFFSALNEVPVTFHDDVDVMTAWREISLAIAMDGGHDVDHIMNVITTACSAVGQPILASDQRFLKKPFGLNPGAVK